MYETDKISSLLVRKLRMYLDHHGLSHAKRKTDNVRIVKAHIGSRILDEMEQGVEDALAHSGSESDAFMHTDDDDDDNNDDDNADEDEDDGEDDSSSDQEIATIVGDDEDDSSSSEMSDVPMDNPPASRYGRRRVDYCQDGCISWDNILFS